MEAITQLESDYFLFRSGLSGPQACIDWALERLGRDEDGGDIEIALLAGARSTEEVVPLADKIVRRYLAADALDDQTLAGKYIVGLRAAFLRGDETVASLDAKLTKLSPWLDFPNWMVMLTRNCEYATDIASFMEPFVQELNYVAGLWERANSLPEFTAEYRRQVSDQHDAR